MIKLATWAAFLALISAQNAVTATALPAEHWRALTEADLATAASLVQENHPAIVSELGDAEFRHAFDSGYKLAKERAARVISYDGYLATLAGFAKAFGDKHVWSRPNYAPINLQWAGLLAGKRGSRWMVVDTDTNEAALKGFEIVSCDGRPVESIARDSIGGFRADWSVEAQQIQQAPWLLVDDGNPFLKRPIACDFRQGADERRVKLDWRQIARSDLLPRVRTAAGYGAAGFGIHPFAGGWWISIQSLNDKAFALVGEARQKAEAIKKGPVVVLDLRGNGGGNSAYGRQLAEALLGADMVKTRLGDALGEDSGCASVWRVSAGNIKTMEEYKIRFGPKLGLDYVREMDTLIAASKQALAERKPFSGKIDCAVQPDPVAKKAQQPAPWPGTFKMILLTDIACFSSCLEVTDMFRELGAIHVGQTTDAATRYFEVRETDLPSGLSKFSTLQAVSLGSPPKIGPFAPTRPYEGDITDTAALEKWIAETFAAPTG